MTAADPQFADENGYDLRPVEGSPCVDTGDDSAVPAGLTLDLDGEARIAGAAVDMGAYEFQPCIGDLNGDGTVFVIDLLMLLMDFGSCDDSPADLDGDGCVGVADLLTLLGNFGPCAIECSDCGAERR